MTDKYITYYIFSMGLQRDAYSILLRFKTDLKNAVDVDEFDTVV